MARATRLWALLALLALLAPGAAYGFCGFYVNGAGAKLFNNATQVVLMRDGTKMVLSMQNHYEGPPDAFAMVVPVPVVLKEKDVKTLDRAVFDRIDQLVPPGTNLNEADAGWQSPSLSRKARRTPRRP